MAAQAAAWLRQQGPPDVSDARTERAAPQDPVRRGRRPRRRPAGRQAAGVYDEIVRRCGVSDETLGRLAAWHETRSKFDEAYKVYRRFEKKPDGLARMATSYRQRKLYPAAVGVYREMIAPGRRQHGPLDGGNRRHAPRRRPVRRGDRRLPRAAQERPDQHAAVALADRHHAPRRRAVEGGHRRPPPVHQLSRTISWSWPSCHRRLKEYREALLLYNQIGADEQHAPWAALQIGMTWEEAGKKEEAIKALQQVCKRFPKSPHASTAHARLQDVYKISVTLGGAIDE